MSNIRISANADAVAALTRRAVLATTAASAMATAMPAQGAPGADAGLTILAQQFADALKAHAAAERARDDCERRYLEDGPAPPAALTRSGPLGEGLRDWEWWSTTELRRLLADRAKRRHWTVARELLALAADYEAVDRDFAGACGLPAAEAAQDSAWNDIEAIAVAIAALPSRTPAALALKARVVKAWGKPEWWDPIDGRADRFERLAAQVLDAAIDRTA